MKHPLNTRGFTLIELMVTVFVLSILTAVALPSFKSFIVSQRIKSASFDISSTLIMARSEAIRRNTNVDINPVSNNWLNGWTVSVGGTTLKNQSKLGSGLTVTCFTNGTLSATCPTITYNNSGRLTGTTSPIQITSNDSSVAPGFAIRCISVDLSGRPYSKKAVCP